MGGSSGVIGQTGSSPITSHGENLRQSDASIQGMPGPSEFIRQEIGIIDGIHPSAARLVTAHTSAGAPIVNGSWIELNHSAEEIAERWGTIRVGFRIRVMITGGSSGQSANATIIGTEGQGITDPLIENNAERGLFSIFGPGCGTG